MTLSIEELKALRRYQADKQLTKNDLAKHLGLGRSTVLTLTRSRMPIRVHTATYQKIMQAIASNY